MFSPKKEEAFIHSMYFVKVAHDITKTHTIFSITSSIVEEENADQTVVKLGDVNSFISACAKLQYVFLYEQSKWNYNPFESEAPPMNFCTNHYAKFLEQYHRCEADWKQLLTKEIAGRFESHPTFPQRMQACGVTEFDVQFDEELVGERLKLQRAADKLWLSYQGKTKWAVDRNNYYIEPQRIVQELADKKNLTKPQIFDLAAALKKLARNDQSIEVLAKGIEEFPDSKQLKFVYGLALAGNFDERAVPFLKVGLTRHNYYDVAGDKLKQLYCILGDEKGLEELREFNRQHADYHVQAYADLSKLTYADNFTPSSAPETVKKLIIDHCKQSDIVSRAYIVQKFAVPYPDKATVVSCNIVMLFFNTLSEARKSDCIDQLADILTDLADEEYIVYSCGDSRYETILNAIKDSRIYTAKGN